MSGNTVRLQAINNVEAYVPPPISFDPGEAPGEIFGANVFTLAEMRLRLPKSVYKSVVATIEKGAKLDPAIAAAMGEARIEVKPEMRTALADAGLLLPETDQPPAQLQAMLRALMDQMAASSADPFDVASALAEATSVMPGELRSFMAHEFALSSHAVLRDSVPLMLLADDQAVRRAAASALSTLPKAESTVLR